MPTNLRYCPITSTSFNVQRGHTLPWRTWRTANRVRSGQPVTLSAKHLWSYRDSKNCMRHIHMRSQPHYDELQTLREVTEQRRHCENGRSICAVAECRSRHDMMNVQSKPIIWTPYAVAQHTTVARLLKHSFLIFPFE